MKRRRATAWAAAWLALLPVAWAGGPVTAWSAVPSAQDASLSGVVTTQDGTVLLPGAAVTIRRPGGAPAATVLTSADGRFRVTTLGPGAWVVEIRLAGFEDARRELTLTAGSAAELAIDLRLQGVTERVVVAESRGSMNLAVSLGPRESVSGSFLEQWSLGGDSLASVLSAMPGVIGTQSGLSIRGGRPIQSRTLLDSSVMEDPFTGVAPLKLPVDAISSIDVMPSPYAVEFGGFSSGVTQVTTRQGTGSWRLTLNNLDPSFRGRRGTVGLRGLRSFAPRVGIGGPVVKDRLSLASSLQYRYTVDDVLGRPESEVAVTHYLSSATRLDASLAAGHSLAFSLSLFPETRTAVNLDTFTPPSAAYNLRNRIWLGSITDSLTLSQRVVLASTLGVGRYGVDTYAAGGEPMVLGVEVNSGNDFTTRSRQSTAVQWSEVLSVFAGGFGGEHLLKAGFEISSGETDSHTDNRPIQVLRADGTRSSEIQFGPPRRQNVRATSAGVFAQDRWQLARRVIAEFGVRFDRDGVLDQSNVAPRASVALGLDRASTMTLRAGAGLFFERSPLNAAAFEPLQTRTVVRYGPDGLTPATPAVAYANVAIPGLRTPRSLAWNVAFDWKLPRAMSVHAGHRERNGKHDLVVDVVEAPGSGRLQLDSTGRSKYRETEAAFAWWPRKGSEFRISYVHSSSEGDLNAYSVLFGVAPVPLIRPNEYGPSPTDVPDRLVARAYGLVCQTWFLQAAVEWRSGLPYSPISEDRAFIGPRNRSRFPAVALVDLAVERQFMVAKWKPWFGLRVSNVLNTFAPLDVQANIASPAFGVYYNSTPRRYAFIVKLSR